MQDLRPQTINTITNMTTVTTSYIIILNMLQTLFVIKGIGSRHPKECHNRRLQLFCKKND